MPGCILHVRGKEFDAAQFLSQTQLIAYRVDESYFGAVVSEADGVLQEQIPDAIEFLQQHKADLQKLAAYEVDSILDFGLWQPSFYEFPMQTHSLPPELLLKAGALNIGIELSHYAVSDEDDETTEGQL